MTLNLNLDRLDINSVETFVTDNAKAMPAYAASSANGNSCAANACSCTVVKDKEISDSE